MRPSIEAVAISAAVNAGTMETFGALGVTPEWFGAYGEEFSFCAGHHQMYGQAPTEGDLLRKFPSFPFVESARDVRYAVAELRRRRTRRDLSNLLERTAEAVARDDVEQAVQMLSTYSPASLAAPAVNVLWDHEPVLAQEDTAHAINVPWPTLQEATGGVKPGQFWAVGARLGQGKSFALVKMCVEALTQRKRAAFFAMEMPKAEVLARVHGTLAALLGFRHLNFDSLSTGDFNPQDYRRFLSECSAAYPGAELFLFGPEDGRVTPSAVQARCADVDIAFVDHLTLMWSDAGEPAISDWRAVGAISNGLRQASLATNTPIVAAAQVNRQGEGQSAKRSEHYPPRLHHLSQGDTIGQDADVAFTLVKTGPSVMAMNVRKVRNGASDVPFWISYRPGVGDFTEISRDEHDIRAEERR